MRHLMHNAPRHSRHVDLTDVSEVADNIGGESQGYVIVTGDGWRVPLPHRW